MAAKIVQIVPRLPPHTDGVGDYALQLAAQLLKDHQIDSHFLVFQQGLELEAQIQGFAVAGLPSPDRTALLSALPADIDGILLQYSNYPYLKTKWDAPFWLPDALQAAIAERSIPLAVVFHELPWLRWKQIRIMNPLQSQVSRRLGRIAKAAIANNAQSQRMLAGWLQRPIPCQPNFSTVGELAEPLPLKDRKRQLVVFGSTDRDRVYRHALPAIRQCYRAWQLDAICDLGKPLNLDQRYDLQGINLIEMGFQPAEVVSELLSDSPFCLLDYSHFPGNLGKSTIFAAACAHGAVPLCTRYNPSEADGLILNRHYAVLGEQGDRLDWDRWQTLAENARRWYDSHNLKNSAKFMASLLLK